MAEAKFGKKKFLIGIDPRSFVILKDHLIEIGVFEAAEAVDEAVLRDLFHLSVERDEERVFAEVEEVTKERKFLAEFTRKNFRDIRKMLEKSGMKVKSDEDVVKGMFFFEEEKFEDEDEVETLDLRDGVTVRKVI